MIPGTARWLVAVAVTVMAATAHAEVIDLEMPDGVVATAAFKAGSKGQPAVVVLHGFLQTREFPAVDHLVQAVSDAGYTVLAPTLSLGVSRRERSLQCEAVHTHTLKGEVAELERWIGWLADRGYDRIVLIGHSFANFHLLSYAEQRTHRAVRKLILISLVGTLADLPEGERSAILAKAREMARRDPKALSSFPISFCRKYPAPVDAYLSYARWTSEQTLAAVRRIKVPSLVVLGGADDRGGPHWVERVKASGASLTVVDGANHFLDGEHEFDLDDVVIRALKEVR